MDKLKELDELLANKNINDDGWYDYVQDQAILKIKNFQEQDWQGLSSIWKSRGEHWQIRLAGILKGDNPTKTVPILEAMAKGLNQEVISEAINSLEGMDGDEYLYVPGEDMIQQMKKIAAGTNSTTLRNTIETLEARAK